MQVNIDNQNYLVFDPKLGGRILELRLLGRLIIRARQTQQLGEGNFLMYPWVNRVQNVPYAQTPPYKDGNETPLHGYYVSSPRKAKVNQNPQSIIIELQPLVEIKDVPKFTQTIILQKGKFHQKIVVHASQNEKIPFCFGYHPYLQIDNQNLINLKVQTDIKTNIKLDQKLMVIYPYQKTEVEIQSDKKYDDLFEGGSFFKLISLDNFNLKISSNLPYWQVYTPPDGKRIAIEPMSFTGNVYKISQTGNSPNLSFGEYIIEAWRQ